MTAAAQRRGAAFLAVPAVIAAAGLLALEAWRLRDPESPLFATPFVYSLAEAIERDDVLRGYDFIRGGQNLNEPIPVRHPHLTGNRTVLVSPLVWAVALNRVESVRMLLGHGARMEGPVDSRALCLAETLGHTDVAGALRNSGQPVSAESCPAGAAGAAPLTAFLAGSR